MRSFAKHHELRVDQAKAVDHNFPLDLAPPRVALLCVGTFTNTLYGVYDHCDCALIECFERLLCIYVHT
jgi:hypothetical protein